MSQDARASQGVGSGAGYEFLSKEIIRLAELTNNWSSTIIIPQGDAFLNISSAAQGKLSVTPDGATNQPNVYPKGQSPSLYRFDPDIFGDNDWHKLKGMLSKRECCLKLDVSVVVN